MTTPQPQQPQPQPPEFRPVGRTLGPPVPRPASDQAGPPPPPGTVPAVPPYQLPVPASPATGAAVPPPGAAAVPAPAPATATPTGRATVPVAGTVTPATVAGRATVAEAVPAAPAAARAAALPPAPAGPFPGVVAAPLPGPPPQPSPTWRVRRHRGLDRLSVGRHAALIGQLDQLQLTSVSFGLLLGRDQAGGPVAVRMFRPAPSHMVLVGGGWAAKLITYRALHFGARLVVVTNEPASWVELGRRATGRTDRVAAVEDLRSPASRVASADTPVLRLAGLSAAAEQDVPVTVLPQWNTRLSELPRATPDQLSPHRARQLAAADVVLAQRLTQPEAAAIGSLLRLPQRVTYALQVMRDDMLAVLSKAGVQYAWLHLTGGERSVLGQPGRY